MFEKLWPLFEIKAANHLHFLIILYQMTMSNVQVVAHSDEPTELPPDSAVSLSFTEVFSVLKFMVLV